MSSDEIVCVRTKNAISLVTKYPRRTIQIVLKLHKQAQDVVVGFDLDCVCVIFDGTHVYALPRYLALTRVNPAGIIV